MGGSLRARGQASVPDRLSQLAAHLLERRLGRTGLDAQESAHRLDDLGHRHRPGLAQASRRSASHVVTMRSQGTPSRSARSQP